MLRIESAHRYPMHGAITVISRALRIVAVLSVGMAMGLVLRTALYERKGYGHLC